MPCSPHDISLEHIDPLSHPLVCGLRVDANEVLASGSYNYSKRNLFVPYRGHAPQDKGDLCEFFIRGSWMLTDFLGEWWYMEAVSILQDHNKYGGPPRVDWEERIRKVEQLGCHVIVGSATGKLSKTSECVKICKHGLVGPMPLWYIKQTKQHCCKAARPRTTKGTWK
jgi:hypothetical protein